MNNETFLSPDIPPQNEGFTNFTGSSDIPNIRTFAQFLPSMVTSLLGVILNCTALTIILKLTRYKVTPTDIFLISQLVFDFGVSISSAVVPIGRLIKPHRLESENFFALTICKIWYSGYGPVFCYNMSVVNCILLTIERYLKIVHPVRHRVMMTNRKAYTVVATLLVCNLCYATWFRAIPTTITAGECVNHTSQVIHYLLNVILFNIVPLSVFIFCYLHMFIVLHKRITKVGPVSVTTSRAMTKQGKNEINCTLQTLTTPSTSYPQPSTDQTKSDALQERSNGQMVQPKSTRQPFWKTQLLKQISQSDSTLAKPYPRARHNFNKAEKNLLKLAILVHLSFIACNTPVRVYFAASYILGYEPHKGSLLPILVTLMHLDICLHPIVYAFTLKKVKDKLKGLIKRH